MSRIDDALRRMSGGSAPEPRPTPTNLDRYESEGKEGIEDALRKKQQWLDDHKITNFVSTGRPADVRASAPPPRATPPVTVPAPQVVHQHQPDMHVDPDMHLESEPLVDVSQIIDYVGFVTRSLRRHKMLAFATVALVIGLSVAAVIFLPRTYFVQTKLLAQRNAVMTALSNPGRAVPWDADAPTRAAAETVLRRENLVSLIAETDLINEWKRTRPFLMRIKDWVVATANRHTPSPDDDLEALIGMLESRMHVEAGPVGDGTVTIDLTWSDPEVAYRLVQAAQQKFLEARQVAETAAIGESIKILMDYSRSLHSDINRTIAELERATPKTASGARRVTRIAPRPAPFAAFTASDLTAGAGGADTSLEGDPALSRMKTTLGNKRTELARIEEGRQRQIADAQTALAQLRTVYTPNHPSVQSAQQKLAAVSQNSPQALALAAEIEEMQADYDKQLGDATNIRIKNELARRSSAAVTQAAADRAAAQAAAAVEPMAAATEPAEALSPAGEFARLRLSSELKQLESVLERTDGARIELAVSQAAFKYRYTVIRPAQVPKDPVAPNRGLILVAGLLASLMLALAVVVVRDLMSGRILEPWQIERRLGLPVLGTLRTA